MVVLFNNIFVHNYFEVRLVLSFCFFLEEGYLLPLIFKLILSHSEANSEPCQISKMGFFTKTVNGFSFLTIFAKSSILDVYKILRLPQKLVRTCGKRSISTVWLGFEITFVLIIFVKLFLFCLRNLINISTNHISTLCTVKSTWPYDQHICLTTKILIVFPNHVFL